MTTVESLKKRAEQLEEQTPSSGPYLHWMSDEELIRAVRTILIKDGHPEAQTASDAELIEMARLHVTGEGHPEAMTDSELIEIVRAGANLGDL
mgnify:CR=1 FL=1